MWNHEELKIPVRQFALTFFLVFWYKITCHLLGTNFCFFRCLIFNTIHFPLSNPFIFLGLKIVLTFEVMGRNEIFPGPSVGLKKKNGLVRMHNHSFTFYPQFYIVTLFLVLELFLYDFSFHLKRKFRVHYVGLNFVVEVKKVGGRWRKETSE